MPFSRAGRIRLDEIVFEEKHYPRLKPTTAQIEKYIDDIRKGDVFPNIVLREDSQSLMDGYHRWKAHIRYRDGYQASLLEEEGLPAPQEDIACEWHTLPEGVSQLLYASSLQNKTGLAKSEADNRDTARRAYQEQEGISKTLLEEYIGVSRKKMAGYLADLEAKHEDTVHQMLMRLDLLGWTQDEMSEALERAFPGSKGTTQMQVSRIFKQNGNFAKMFEEFSESNHPPEVFAKRHDMPLILAWALKMHGLKDDERLEQLDISLQPYDVWHFNGCHDLYGTDWPGRIPGQLVAHVLYFFTQSGHVVIDPMAGSGTTPDICLALGRKCYAYDINQTQQRADILSHNISTEGWPERTKKADLIFWDPPYFDKKDAEYMEGSISELARGPYLDFFKARFREAYELVKKGTRMAFLMSDWNDEEQPGSLIGLWHYAALLEEADWTITRRIDCPLSTQQIHPDIVVKFRESRRLTRLNRSLLIAEKR